MNAEEYQLYLLSPAWKQRARECLEIYENECAVCECNWRRRDIHVHHFHYRNVGHESQEDLVALCKTHHHEIHESIAGYDREGLLELKKSFLERFESRGRIRENLYCSECYNPIDSEAEDFCCENCGGRPKVIIEEIETTGFQKVGDIAANML